MHPVHGAMRQFSDCPTGTLNAAPSFALAQVFYFATALSLAAAKLNATV